MQGHRATKPQIQRQISPNMLRVVASIYTGAVRAYDVVTMLQRNGHATALGEVRPPMAGSSRSCTSIRQLWLPGRPGSQE
jgi:hypothetical protein